MTARDLLLGLALLVPMSGVTAQAANGKPSFEFKPAMLDSKDGARTTLGLEYSFEAKRSLTTLGGDAGSDALDLSASVKQLSLAFGSRGTLTPDASRNPRNFIDFNGSIGALISTEKAGTFAIGGVLAYEADQSFINKQRIAGGKATYGKLAVLGKTDFFSVTSSYAQVDPTADATRTSLLPTGAAAKSSLKPYGRLSAEGLYLSRLALGPIESLELNIRYYVEPSAPASIKQANLDRHVLGTIRLGLSREMFVAYSVGSLPFDRKDDRVYALGWAYKLK